MAMLRGAGCRVRVTSVWMCKLPVAFQLCLYGPQRDMCSPREIGGLVSALVGALEAPSGVSWRPSRGCEVRSVLGTRESGKM